MNYFVYRVGFSYISPILGINPDRDLGKEYVMSKAEKEIEKLEKRLSKVKDDEERRLIEASIERIKADLREKNLEAGDEVVIEDLRVMRFARDGEGRLCLYHYQMKGHMKEVASLYLQQSVLRNKITRYIDIIPDEIDVEEVLNDWSKGFYIPFKRNGFYIYEPDEVLTRPLRSFIRGQYIITIVSSEVLNPPVEQWFQVVCWGEDIGEGELKRIFDIGMAWGNSGWRSARYGRYRLVHLEKVVSYGIKKKQLKIRKGTSEEGKGVVKD